MTPSTSSRDLEVLAYIAKFIEDQGFPPTVREIGEGVGMSSPATVQTHLVALTSAGLVERTVNGSPRALRVTPQGEATMS